MSTADNIKTAKAGAKAAKAMATDVTEGLSIFKALTNDEGSKISNGTAASMGGVALLLDIVGLLGLIPAIGWIISPIVYVVGLGIFWGWFKLHGINFFSSRAMASKGITAVLEIIPEVEAVVPGNTINVGAAIAVTRMEEYAAKEASKEKGGKPEGVKTQTTSGPDAEVKTPRRGEPPLANQPPERSNVVQFRPQNTQDVVAPSIKQWGESNPPQADKIAA